MQPIQYSCSRSEKRKTASISVLPGGQVKLAVPFHFNDADIEQLIVKHQRWIRKKIAELENTDFPHQHHCYEEGEAFLHKGKLYSLQLREGRGKVTLKEEKIIVQIPQGYGGEERKDYTEQKIRDWYKTEALEILREKCISAARKWGFKPVFISVKDYKSRWGCCFHDGRIFFNWRIIMAPVRIIDYVVAHELCHLKQPNHSAQYWKLVQNIIPDWKERRTWLRLNGHTLDL